jgi:hypothetical protein
MTKIYLKIGCLTSISLVLSQISLWADDQYILQPKIQAAVGAVHDESSQGTMASRNLQSINSDASLPTNRPQGEMKPQSDQNPPRLSQVTTTKQNLHVPVEPTS